MVHSICREVGLGFQWGKMPRNDRPARAWCQAALPTRLVPSRGDECGLHQTEQPHRRYGPRISRKPSSEIHPHRRAKSCPNHQACARVDAQCQHSRPGSKKPRLVGKAEIPVETFGFLLVDADESRGRVSQHERWSLPKKTHLAEYQLPPQPPDRSPMQSADWGLQHPVQVETPFVSRRGIALDRNARSLRH